MWLPETIKFIIVFQYYNTTGYPLQKIFKNPVTLRTGNVQHRSKKSCRR